MKEQYDKNSPLIKNLKKLIKPCKDYERISAWKEALLEIGKATGISSGTIRNWFSYYRIPFFCNVQKIADYKKVDVYDLYVNEDRWVKIFHLSPERQEIIKKLVDMENEQFFNTINLDMLKNNTEIENKEEKKESEKDKKGEGLPPSP